MRAKEGIKEEERIFQIKQRKAQIQSLLFYLFRIFPISKKKIVFTTNEGTTGYMCNPKYIAQELIDRNSDFKLVWLVNNSYKTFPNEIIVKKNTLFNRAFQLTTAKIWIDNSRKQLEVRKRKHQIYIQTWHAKIGFKPTGLDRGKTFSRIAKEISIHDSKMIDYMISNCDMFDQIAPTGLLYEGEILRTGSPRLDKLVKRSKIDIEEAKTKYGINKLCKVVLWAPTFRGGSQSINREIDICETPDFNLMLDAFKKRFGGDWTVFLRLHPQLAARGIFLDKKWENVFDVSKEEDIYEVLIACDAVVTDYSSVAFDAATAGIPVFLFCKDYEKYVNERGDLLWNVNELPFPFSETDEGLKENIMTFDNAKYEIEVETLLSSIRMVEDGEASKRVADFVCEICDK